MRITALILTASFATATIAQTQQAGGGTISTAAGTGIRGFGGDNGPATQATLNFITGDPNIEDDFGHVAVDAAGNLYIADKANHRIRRVDRNGVITTIAGSTQGSHGDGGRATAALLNFPAGLAVDRSGNIYIGDQDNNRVRRIDGSGNISTVAGDGSTAVLDGPCAVAVDTAGNIYIADTFNDRIRRVAAGTGAISTIAGTGQHADLDPGSDNVPGTSLSLGWPSGLAVDPTGRTLFISDHHNNIIRALDLETGLIRRIAGTGQHSDDNPSGDAGPATAAPLGYPMGLAFDAGGNLYVADMHNNAVRRISAPLTAQAVISTPVGLGIRGFAGDGGPAWNARLSSPTGLAIDSSGNLIFGDWYNGRVRRVTPGSSTPRPLLFEGGLVNGASFGPPGSRVAPGSIVSIFGRRLASGRAVASELPLPISLLEPRVSVTASVGSNTFFMPLFFVSPDQINAQLPAELPNSGSATVVVRVGDTLSEPLTINLSSAGPGIFTYDNARRAVAVNQDGKLNTFVEAAAPGSVITVYLTGQGELRPPVPTGQPAPSDPLSRATLEAAATIGGVPARIEFLGATPGFVGLTQANIVVPDNAPTGDQPVTISVAGQPSNRPVITIR